MLNLCFVSLYQKDAVYTGKDTGDLYIKCFSSNRIIHSEIYVIVGCNFYDSCSTDTTSNYSKRAFEGSTGSLSYNSNNYYDIISNGTKSWGLMLPVDSTKLEVTFKLNSRAEGGIALTSGVGNALCVRPASTVYRYANSSWNSAYRPSVTGFPSSQSTGVWYTLKVEFIEDTAYCTLINNSTGNTYEGSFELSDYIINKEDIVLCVWCGGVYSDTTNIKEIKAY